VHNDSGGTVLMNVLVNRTSSGLNQICVAILLVLTSKFCV
jgi:hypothetical protein